jgi:hypothetical protein
MTEQCKALGKRRKLGQHTPARVFTLKNSYEFKYTSPEWYGPPYLVDI